MSVGGQRNSSRRPMAADWKADWMGVLESRLLLADIQAPWDISYPLDIIHIVAAFLYAPVENMLVRENSATADCLENVLENVRENDAQGTADCLETSENYHSSGSQMMPYVHLKQYPPLVVCPLHPPPVSIGPESGLRIAASSPRPPHAATRPDSRCPSRRCERPTSMSRLPAEWPPCPVFHN
jgi:hypothetical protein